MLDACPYLRLRPVALLLGFVSFLPRDPFLMIMLLYPSSSNISSISPERYALSGSRVVRVQDLSDHCGRTEHER